jgi:hypothetical protein
MAVSVAAYCEPRVNRLAAFLFCASPTHQRRGDLYQATPSLSRVGGSDATAPTHEPARTSAEAETRGSLSRAQS